MFGKAMVIAIIALMSLMPFAGCIFGEDGKKGEDGNTEAHDEYNEVQSIIENMTIEEKIGQMWLIEIGDILPVSAHTRYMVEEYKVGSVIVYDWNAIEPAQLAMLTNDMQGAAENTSKKIPLFICADHEGGVWAKMQLRATLGPGNMAIGATHSIEDAYMMGKVMGTELKAVGINVNFAPVHDVNCNPDNPIIGVRSFGGRPELVNLLGPAMLKGMQDAGIVACAKHFPGHGDTNVDSHSGLPIVVHNKSRLYSVELAPFQAAVEADVGMIMTAHIIYPAFDDSGKPATLSKPILTDLLKGEMGFDGVIITDAMTMGAITNHYAPDEACIMAIQAGADIILDTSQNPQDVGKNINAVKKAVEDGKISMERIDDAVRRVLALKQKLGLWENRYVDPQKAEEIVGCEEHKKIEDNIARDSITIVQNDGIIPLKVGETDNILVVEVADPLGLVGSIGGAAKTMGILTQEIQKRHPLTTHAAVSLNTTDAEIEIVRTLARTAKIVIVGTQRFVWAGVDMGYEGQTKLVNALIEDGKSAVVIGMRDPYDLRLMPKVNGYIALYTFRECSALHAVKVLFGEEEAKGILPVDIPGVHPYGYAANFGMICGRVFDEKGNPITGARITIEGTDYTTASIEYVLPNIAQPGEFTLFGLAAGNYTLKISAPGFLDLERHASVRIGNVTESTITMENAMEKEETTAEKFIPGFEITGIILALGVLLFEKRKFKRRRSP